MSQGFYKSVYAVVSKIPQGKVATYADVAAFAGSPRAFRAVGTAMKNNSDTKTVPCHRVVGSDGKMHGYAFGEGEESKQEKLKQEGVPFIGQKVDLKTARAYFSRWEKF